MSDYRRFISYVYEYHNGKKTQNRGFIKAEARDGICQLNLALKGLCKNGSGSCRIYAFCPKNGYLEGSLLHSQEVQNGLLSASLRFPEDQLGELHYPLSKVTGLAILNIDGTIYATQWDDSSIHFDGFPNLPSSLTDESSTEPSQAPPEALADAPAEPSGLPSKSYEDAPEDLPEPLPESLQQPAPTESGEEPPAEEPATDSASTQPTQPPEAIDTVQATSTEASAHDVSYFNDGSIYNCVKITPCDISRLDPRDQHLSNNRFLHYGYQSFGHLLLGQLSENGQTVLCVPGTYHQQECMMANMFGFSHFKRCHQKDSSHCFGYWYRSVHPADSHK